MTRISEFVIDVNDHSIREAIVNIGRYTSAAGQMKKNIEQVEAQLKLLETQGKANTKEYERQTATLGRYSAEQELNTAALKANLATVKAYSKETLSSKGTYAYMKMQVQELTQAMEKLDLTTNEGGNLFIQYREQLQKIKGDMAIFEEAIASTSAEGDMLSVRFGAAFSNLGGYVQEAGNSFKELRDAVAIIGIDGLTEAMGGAATAVDNARKAYSGFQAVLKLGNGIIGAYHTITTSITAAKEAYRAGVSAATIVQRAFNTAVTSNPLGLVIGLVASAAAAFASYKLGADEATESQQEFNDALREAQGLVDDSYDVNTMLQVIDKLSLTQIEKLRVKTEQQIELISNKLLQAEALQKEIDALKAKQSDITRDTVINLTVSNQSDMIRAPQAPVDTKPGKPPGINDEYEVLQGEIAKKQQEIALLNIGQLKLANESYNKSLHTINKTMVERKGHEDDLEEKINTRKNTLKNLQAEQHKLTEGTEEYNMVNNQIILIENEIVRLEQNRKEAHKSSIKVTKEHNEQTVTFANTINGLSKQISTLMQSQQNLDLSTEEGKQAYAKYAIEIEQVNQELEKQQTLAENLSLAAKPVSIKPVDGTENTKDPFAGMEKVELPDAEDEKAVKVEGIITKAQKAADAFGKMNEALDLAEQISDVRLQNELARIDEKRQAEIDAVNDSVLSEEEKKRRIEDINKRFDKQAEEKKKAAAKREKAFAITKTIIAGAQAVAQGIAQFGPPPSPAGIAAIAAAAVTTATQLALIAKQKFAKGGYIPFEEGGTIQGASHALGGVPFFSGGRLMEAEGGELIVNRNIWSRPDFVRNISEMNALTGGKRFFASGGVVPSPPPAFVSSTLPAEAFDNEALIRGLRGVIAEEVGSLRVVNNVVDTTSQQQRLVNIQANASF